MASQAEVLSVISTNVFGNLMQVFNRMAAPESDSRAADSGQNAYLLFVEQKGKIDKEVDSLSTRSYAELRKYQAKDYKINSMKFYYTYILHLTLMLSFVWSLFALMSMNIIRWETTVVISTLSMLLLLAMFYISFKRNAHRHKYNWDKFYWTIKRGETM
jgi:membrane-associated HD superfamily phosphohydrolase